MLKKGSIKTGSGTLRLASVLTHSDNMRVSGSGFQPSPKSPSAELQIPAERLTKFTPRRFWEKL